MKVIGIIRVSTDEQALGPLAQRQAIETWCQANGAELAAVHEDIAVSGAAPLDKRPGLMAAIDALEPGYVLLAAKRDRFARDVMLAAMIERLTERAGATIATADGVGAGDSPEAAMMRGIIDVFAQYERAIIRSRVRSSLAVKKAAGEGLGRAGYGKTYEAKGGHLVADDAEAVVVARIVELRTAGATLQAIADTLTAEGVPTKRGGKWAPATVANILKAAQ